MQRVRPVRGALSRHGGYGEWGHPVDRGQTLYRLWAVRVSMPRRRFYSCSRQAECRAAAAEKGRNAVAGEAVMNVCRLKAGSRAPAFGLQQKSS